MTEALVFIAITLMLLECVLYALDKTPERDHEAWQAEHNKALKRLSFTEHARD